MLSSLSSSLKYVLRIIVCAVLLCDWQHSSFVYTGITTNTGVMCCTVILQQLPRHSVIQIFQLYYNFMRPPWYMWSIVGPSCGLTEMLYGTGLLLLQLLSYRCSLYTLEMEDRCVKNIFFHSVVCLFPFLGESFNKRMYLNFLLFFNSDFCDVFKNSFLHYHKHTHYFLKSLLFSLSL